MSNREHSADSTPPSAKARSAARQQCVNTRTKKPVRLNNKFVAGLPPRRNVVGRRPQGDRLRGAGLSPAAANPSSSTTGSTGASAGSPSARFRAGPPTRRASGRRNCASRSTGATTRPAHKRERREAPTVQDLIDRYVEDHLPKKSTTPTRVADEKKMLAEIGKHLGKHTKVVDVHGGDIGEMHRNISEFIGRGGKPRRVRANRILTVCSKMFSLSLVPRAGETLPWRNAVLGNPCKGIERNHEEGRERFFSQAELAAISDALEEYPRRRRRLRPPHHAHRLSAGRGDEGGMVGVRQRTRLLDQAVRTPSNARCTSCR